MRRTLVLAATHALLWTLVGQANHFLAGWRAYLFVGGLYVVYAALTQPRRSGLAASLLGGALCDAGAPAGLFGTHVILFAAAHVIVFHIRDRVPRDDTTARVIVVLFTNFALFLLFSFRQIHLLPVPAAAWPRLLVDLVYSQFALVLIAPWFMALQARALALTGADREATA